MNGTIDTRVIGQLAGIPFFVPAYQRGYRWTENEVRALLEDVWDFDTENGALRYCIQPLIVQPRADGKYEVVDGQQRLTTIFLFMRLARGKAAKNAPPLFSLEYETRPGSAEFLRTLPQGRYEENIDFHFMGRACQAMRDWVRAKAGREGMPDFLNALYEKFRDSVFFIWYELPAREDPIEMFQRVNIGRIPLTDAELIKALLLDSAHFHGAGVRRQTEIAVLWDKIEQELHHEPFWYFLNGKEPGSTRIDMLFSLLAQQYGREMPEIDARTPHYPFLVFSEAVKRGGGTQACVEGLWRDVELLYEELRSWYEDYNRYHLIGYAIAQGKSISALRARMAGKGKRAALKALLADVRAEYGQGKVEDLTYEQGKKVRRTLLLFNIATLVCESDHQTRFPFDLYKKEQWDIEHIHATGDRSAGADDGIGNLTLLNLRINRAYEYRDVPFEQKRQVILEESAKGNFIPVCTKNVFLKSFTRRVQSTVQWDENDKAEYIETMKATLKTFFAGRWIAARPGETG